MARDGLQSHFICIDGQLCINYANEYYLNPFSTFRMAEIQAGRNCILHPPDLLARAPLCNASATCRSAFKLGLYTPISQWSLIKNWKNVTQRDGAILAREGGPWEHKCTFLFRFLNFDVQFHQERKVAELNEGHFRLCKFNFLSEKLRGLKKACRTPELWAIEVTHIKNS